jgi:hypothetical protein
LHVHTDFRDFETVAGGASHGVREVPWQPVEAAVQKKRKFQDMKPVKKQARQAEEHHRKTK